MNDPIIAAGLAVAIIVLLMLFRWRWRNTKVEAPACTPMQLVHRLCPHNNVVQGIEVEQKDSLDDHLDVLTRKLADKEGRLRLSKYKIRETQNEIENLHALDNDVKTKYREIMNMLKQDLLSNEKECKKIQEQIEWVSRRRAELNSEVISSARADAIWRSCSGTCEQSGRASKGPRRRSSDNRPQSDEPETARLQTDRPETARPQSDEQTPETRFPNITPPPEGTTAPKSDTYRLHSHQISPFVK